MGHLNLTENCFIITVKTHIRKRTELCSYIHINFLQKCGGDSPLSSINLSSSLDDDVFLSEKIRWPLNGGLGETKLEKKEDCDSNSRGKDVDTHAENTSVEKPSCR